MRTRISATVLMMVLSCAAGAFAALPDFHGFVETDVGIKLSDDTTKRDAYNFLEQRLQLKTSHYFEGGHYLAQKNGILNFKGDFTVDEYFNGATDFSLREFNLAWTPFSLMDVKLGRQILTWGTGDYLFVNDLFPKDYVSFFIGRDDEYLKKPSDALKVSLYPKVLNIDFVMIPYFTPNTVAEGDRLSFYDNFQGGIAGREADRHIVSPPFQLSNSEYALRAYRALGSNELAFYYFRGFDKNPRSIKDPAARQLFYQRLDVYGASLRGPVAGGIGNVEFGYYNSREDPNGQKRLIENSMLKLLTGYTKDMGGDLRIGLQYLYEQRLDYDNYEAALMSGDVRFDEFRHLLTMRLNKLYKNQTVEVGLFVFFSPSDKDGYARPYVNYDLTDAWKLTLGANLPWGEDVFTEFGQMQRNKNVYLRVRYSF